MAKQWIGKARERMEKKGTVGSLHRALGVPEGEKIPASKMAAGQKRANRTGNAALKKKLQFAENVKK
jgi:hypothetical protein